ncbi:MAG: twitching motility protein PilT [Planctomycetota bacterium]|nr:MAG: twitching motility protein PilT [Planctomycetota bacterium]
MESPPRTNENVSTAELEIDKLFRAVVKLDGSDLHMKPDKPPFVRVTGALRPLNRPPVDDAEMQRLVDPLLTDRLRAMLEATGGADFAYTLTIDDTTWRFRLSVFRQMGRLGLVARKVNAKVPDFASLHLPPTLEKLCHHQQGMVLVAGPTGSGKSTTIASMLDFINHQHRRHIITLEDPIEFVFTEDKCLVTQREIGLDVVDFEHGMKQVVREDPDVMLVGEMRDRTSFMTAMQAAETGHLVFATIHASSAATTIGRILDLFPSDMHHAVRMSIAANMRGIVAQKLLPSIVDGVSRVPAVELMLYTPVVQKLVIEAQDDKLASAIRIGAGEGMQDFTMSLKGLVETELVDRQVAIEAAPNADELKMALKGISIMAGGIL